MITYCLGDSARLGNQMFCIATVYGYADKYNEDPQFYPYKYFDLPILKTMPDNIFFEPHEYFTDIPYQSNLELRGYFQSYKYFNHIEDKIREKVFHFPSAHNTIDFVSIHIRRGDYLLYSDRFVNCTIEYYKEAMQLMGGNNKNFLIFSDDIQWCVENFKGENIEFSCNNSELADMVLMSQCKNHIISASSYSWWAAYLSANNDKQVIAPSQWWVGEWSHRIQKDICPDNWHRLNPYL